MDGSAHTFDPFASAGWTPVPSAPPVATAPRAYQPVIDVGGPAYDPAIPTGAQGSQMAPASVTGRPGAGGDSMQDTMRILLGGEPKPGVEPNPDRTALAPGPRAAAPTKKPDEFDPFAAAGWSPEPKAGPATPSTAAPISSQELRNQPWHQPLTDAIMSVVGAVGSLKHGASMGLDEILEPLVPALAETLRTGAPFSQAYDKAVSEQRQPRKEFERVNPALGTALEVTGGIPAAVATAPLFGTAAPGATLGTRAITAGRNLAAGVSTGAASGAGMREGGPEERLKGAEQGGVLGGIATAAVPVLSAIARRVPTAVAPTASVDNLAGQALRERAGLAPHDPVPTPDVAPIPNMPIGSGAAFRSPGLAAEERLINAGEDAGALAQRTQQNAAIGAAATGPQPGGARLAYPMDVPEASRSVVTALQRAHGVLRDEEERLWTSPLLTAVQPDVPALVARVQRSIAALPERFQNAIGRNADVNAALHDLYSLPPTATLADINMVRSDILAASRSLPFSERFAKKAADDAARAVLDAIESNPALRTNPAALAAYQRARDFTREMRSALDKPQFQNMLQATEGNRKGIDPGTVAGQMFKFAQGTERTPEGVSRIIDMLDGIRRTWGGLATSAGGVPLPGLNPATAFAARAELAQGTRDFIVNSMLNSATATARDAAGNQGVVMNRLSNWIDTNRGWIARSRVFNPAQIDLLDRIRESAVMAARTENFRGGAGSPTFERLKGDKYIDAFVGPLFGRTLQRGGGLAAGALATHIFGEAAIGGMVGQELVGGAGGHGMANWGLNALYNGPREVLRQRVAEAIRNPVIAEDLMRNAGSSLSPETRAWGKALLAEMTAGQTERAFGGADPEFGAPAQVKEIMR